MKNDVLLNENILLDLDEMTKEQALEKYKFAKPENLGRYMWDAAWQACAEECLKLVEKKTWATYEPYRNAIKAEIEKLK